MDCLSCGSPVNAQHLSDCPVLRKLSDLEMSLRMNPDPEKFANINLDFEPVPDGPLDSTGAGLNLHPDTAKICGGLVVKSIAADIPTMGHVPGLIFQFHTVMGRTLAPIVFIPESESDFMAVKMLVSKAVNAARNAALEANKAEGGKSK